MQRHPDQFYGFVGTGQMVASSDRDIRLQFRRAAGPAARRQGQGSAAQGPGSAPLLHNRRHLEAGQLPAGRVRIHERGSPIDNSDGFNTFQDILSPEYGLYDKASWARGIFDSGNVMFPQLWKADVDFRRDVPPLMSPCIPDRPPRRERPTALAEGYTACSMLPTKS